MAARRRLAAVADSPRRAVISLRVSRVMGRDGDSFHAPDMQEDACRRFCAERGWPVVAVVSDLDVSGGVFDRPGLNEALRMLDAGEATALVTYDVSRLGRKVKETLDVIDRVRASGAVYASVKERFDDTPEGEHLLHTFLSIAHLYRRQRGRQWQEVLERRARQGRQHGSIPPFGYLLGMRPHPEEGPWMAEAFRRYADGDRVAHIAKDLGLLRGKRHAIETLKVQLANPVYVGRVRHGGHVYPGAHEPLVDEDLWERVQARLQADTWTAPRHLAVSHSLVGLVVCDLCGHKLQLHRDRRKGEIPRLQCPQRRQGWEGCPGPGTPSAAEIEQAVFEAVTEQVRTWQLDMAGAAAKRARHARAEVDVTRLRRELEETERALGNLAVDLGRRVISPTAYQRAAEQLELAAESLRRRLADSKVAATAPLERTVNAAELLTQHWGQMTVEERLQAFQLIVREVRVRRAERYREPLKVGGRLMVEWL